MRSLGLEGVEKDGAGWRLFYNDYKFKLNKKIREIKSQISAIGGGRRKKIVLSECEERLYDILGRDLGEPISGVRLNPLDSNTADVTVDVDDGLASVHDASTILAALETGNMSSLETVEGGIVKQAVPGDSSKKKPRRCRRRKNRDENALPSSCARDETELSQAQLQFWKIEEMASNSRLVLAESNNNVANAIHNLAAAIRESKGGFEGNVRGNKKRRRIICSDSE